MTKNFIMVVVVPRKKNGAGGGGGVGRMGHGRISRAVDDIDILHI